MKPFIMKQLLLISKKGLAWNYIYLASHSHEGIGAHIAALIMEALVIFVQFENASVYTYVTAAS